MATLVWDEAMAKVFIQHGSAGSQGWSRRTLLPIAVVLTVATFWALGKGLTAKGQYEDMSNLPKAQQPWIDQIQQRLTADGSTVSEVLAYAERERPTLFKISDLQVQFDSSGQKPESVTINYWIGSNRKPNDSYVDLSYVLNSQGRVQPIPRSALTLRALEGGKASFIQQVDAIYALACKPLPDSKAKC